MTEEHHKLWKKDLEELHEVKGENKLLQDDFETIECLYNTLKPVNKHLEAENKRLKTQRDNHMNAHIVVNDLCNRTLEENERLEEALLTAECKLSYLRKRYPEIDNLEHILKAD